MSEAGRRLYLLGGTAFSRRILAGLEDAGYQVRLSVATSLGADEVDREPAGGVQVGRLTPEQLSAELQAWAAAALVDATHPYAVEASAMARKAVAAARIPLLRATRPAWRPPEGSHPVRFFASEGDLAEELLSSGHRALFTLGAQGLRPFGARGLHLAARVLSSPDSLQAALALGVAPADLVAAYPPYGVEFTASCMRHLECSVIVSKESGADGGLDEKLAAAEMVGGELFVLARPSEQGRVYHDVEALLKGLEELWTRS